MRLLLTSGTTRTEAWALTTQVEWSGSKTQAARSLSFGLAAAAEDPGQPAADCPLGAQVQLLDDSGGTLFSGTVVERSAATGSGVVTVTAMDRGMYLANNDGTYLWRGSWRLPGCQCGGNFPAWPSGPSRPPCTRWRPSRRGRGT